MDGFPRYYNVPGVQEEFHVLIYKDNSISIRCDGLIEKTFPSLKSDSLARNFVEEYILEYLSDLGDKKGEFGDSRGWLEKYLVEE